jgi:hypothetical protein
VFILEHYFASKSFAAVREAFSNSCPDKEVPNKTGNKISGQKKCLSVTSAQSDKTAEFVAVPISSSASAASTRYDNKN